MLGHGRDYVEGLVITFRTESGSVYEVDEVTERVRCRARLAHPRGGSSRLPPGGPWVIVEDVMHDGLGAPLYIFFHGVDNPVATSPVVEVIGLSISENSGS